MGIKDKLFYDTDDEIRKKRISKTKIISMITLTLVIIFLLIAGIVFTMAPKYSAVEIQNKAYDCLPNGSLNEKVDYVLNHYSWNGTDMSSDEYFKWLGDSGIDVGYNLDLESDLFRKYDKNHDKLLNRDEIKNFLSDKK